MLDILCEHSIRQRAWEIFSDFNLFPVTENPKTNTTGIITSSHLKDSIQEPTSLQPCITQQSSILALDQERLPAD